MTKSKVSDPITDQEIAFARLVLSGTMTDRRAAEAVGLNPGTAAYTKSKPRVRAYLLEHRAAVQQQRAQQHTEELRQCDLSRDLILARLWEIAKMDPERTRGSMSAQVKSLSMIIAIEGLIPDRRAVAAQDKPAPPPVNVDPPFYVAAWRRAQQDGEIVDPQTPPPAADLEFASAPGSVDPPSHTPGATPNLGAPQPDSAPPPSRDSWVPDTRAPFSINKNRFGRRR